MSFSKEAVIGLDIGGTKTLAVLFDEKFRVLDECRFKTEPGKGPRSFDRRLSKVIKGLVRSARRARRTIVATGIGCSGKINSSSDDLEVSPHIPFLKGHRLLKKITAWTGSRVHLGNDVQMGLYGEHRLGAARGAVNALAVFIGTGIGGAMLINGELYSGSSGVAGDIGHYLVQPLGPLGGSERQGVLDNIGSRTAIAAEAAVFASRQWAPHLAALCGGDINQIHSKMLARAIVEGDQRIRELVLSRAHIVGIVLSNLVDFINPDTVVLGGGLVEEMPRLMRQGVLAGIEAHTTSAAFKHLRVVVTQLKSRAVATGAAKMAWDIFEDKPPKSAELAEGIF